MNVRAISNTVLGHSFLYICFLWILIGLFTVVAAFLICKFVDFGRAVYRDELL